MGKKTEFLYLSEADLIKAGVLDSKRCVDVLDEMFRLLGEGDYVLGGPRHNEHGIKISFPKEPLFPNMPADGPDRRFMAMVGYLGGRFHVAGEKWYGSNIINPSRGLPRSILMVMLNDADTCEPIALMSGNLISAVRTGSVPGVGVRYLARKNSEVCTIVGAGPVNRACFQGIMVDAIHIKKVVIYDVIKENADKFASWAKKEYDVECMIADSMEQAVKAGDIISVAASRLKPVIIKDEWFKEGSTALFTGASQVDESYWKSAKLFFDNTKMHAAYMEDARRGEGTVEQAYNGMMGGVIYQMIDDGKLPEINSFPSLGDVACKRVKGRTNDTERCALMTGGLPSEDVAWAYDLYLKAKEMGLGQVLTLWDEPHWS